jgi:hypothetical protein
LGELGIDLKLKEVFMIIVKLQGGLGNQMFQYAAALSLSKRLGKVLKLDPVFFKDVDDRNFGLNVFNISLSFASSIQSKIFRNDLNPILKSLLSIVPGYQPFIYSENQFHFNPHLFDIKKKISI